MSQPVSDGECGVCYEPITVQALLSCCQHEFCIDCIRSWVKKSDKCPVCLRTIDQFEPFTVGSKPQTTADGPVFEYDLSGISFDPGKKKRRATRQEEADKKARTQQPPPDNVFHFGYSDVNQPRAPASPTFAGGPQPAAHPTFPSPFSNVFNQSGAFGTQAPPVTFGSQPPAFGANPQTLFGVPPSPGPNLFSSPPAQHNQGFFGSAGGFGNNHSPFGNNHSPQPFGTGFGSPQPAHFSPQPPTFGAPAHPPTFTFGYQAPASPFNPTPPQHFMPNQFGQPNMYQGPPSFGAQDPFKNMFAPQPPPQPFFGNPFSPQNSNPNSFPQNPFQPPHAYGQSGIF